MEAAPRIHNERRGGHRRMRRRAPIPAFGNWEQQQVTISQYFDYCATKPEPEPLQLVHHSHSHASSVYPYAHSDSPVYTCYVDHSDHHPFPFHAAAAAGANNNHYDAPLQHHFNIKKSNGATEVKGPQSRTQRRQRSYLGGADNNRKVFDITETEAIPTPTLTDKCYGHSDVVVTPDLYNVGSANVTTRKDEDLYKIPPELLRKSKGTKKMRNFFTKCLVTICASY